MAAEQPHSQQPAPHSAEFYEGDITTRFEIAYQLFEQKLCELNDARQKMTEASDSFERYGAAMEDLVTARDMLRPEDESVELGRLLIKHIQLQPNLDAQYG